MKKPYYLITDGELTLELWPAEEGGFNVTCPWDPGLNTQAESVHEAFEMAYDAQQALLEARNKTRALKSDRPDIGGGPGQGRHDPEPFPAPSEDPIAEPGGVRPRRNVVRPPTPSPPEVK